MREIKARHLQKVGQIKAFITLPWSNARVIVCQMSYQMIHQKAT